MDKDSIIFMRIYKSFLHPFVLNIDIGNHRHVRISLQNGRRHFFGHINVHDFPKNVRFFSPR